MNGSITFVWSSASLFFGIALVVASAMLCFAAWQRSGFGRGVGTLESLRFLLVAGIAVTLNQPEWRETYLPDQRPTVSVMWDQSRSMETKDIVDGDGGPLRSRAETVQSLLQQPQWAALNENVEVVFEPFSSSQQPPREATDLNAALETALQRHPNLRGIVLLTDGDWNTGDPPIRGASRLRSRGIPVFTVGIGSETRLPDLELVSVDAPTFGVKGKPLRIPFTIDSALPRDHDTTVTFETSGGEEISIPVRVPAMGRLQDTVTWNPESTGDVTLTLTVPHAVGEIDQDNNRLEARIAIRNEQLKVLIIESFPRWEYRYLRNALERDPGVDVDCLLFQPLLSKVGGGRDYLKAFPDDAQLAQYDVVFLGDVGVSLRQLSDGECGRLQRLVRDQAAGLVFLPGARGNHYTILDTELGDLYPVILDETRKRGIGSQLAGRMELTEAGRNSLLTKLEDGDAANSQVWESLPGFQWHAAALRAKAGTETLATHRSSSSMGPFGRVPLIVTKTFGTGKVLFMGTDSAWRWREGVEDKYHYRFWGQVARWMAYQRNMSEGQSMRLFYTPDRPKAGNVVNLNANVSSALGEPLREGTVVVQIASPSGQTQSVRLLSDDELSWGLFTGSFTPDEAGDYTLLMTSNENPATLKLTMAVQGTKLERLGRPARLAVLEEIAQVTRGKMLSPDRFDTVLDMISGLPESGPLERRMLIWCHPIWAGLLILLFVIFWTGRKMAGAL